MKSILLSGIALSAFTAISQAQQPMCLIGQTYEANGRPRVNMANPMAEEMDQIGQLRAVVYAMDDPILRDAVNEGKIAKPAKVPELKDAVNASKLLNIPYMLWIETNDKAIPPEQRTKGAIFAKMTLYKDGRAIWSDAESLSVQVGGNASQDTTARSLVISFLAKMKMGPLKALPATGKKNDPTQNPGTGQAPIIPETSDDDPILNDFAAIQQRVSELMGLGRMAAAEMLLRDSIDAAPKEGDRRRALILFLKEQGQVDAAVKVTVDAAAALGEPSLTGMAARILIDAGRYPEASEMVNETLATNPNDAPTRIMAAELRMREALPDQALKHLEQAIKTQPSAEAFMLRALCRGLMGAEDGVNLDLERALKDDPKARSTYFLRLSSIFDAAMAVEGADIRALFQKALLKPASEEVADSIDSQERLAKACLKLFPESCPMPKYQGSHGMRVLALNLLQLTMTELRGYTAKPNEDSMSEARIDFGEMLRNLASAKEEFLKESKDATTGSTSGHF